MWTSHWSLCFFFDEKLLYKHLWIYVVHNNEIYLICFTFLLLLFVLNKRHKNIYTKISSFFSSSNFIDFYKMLKNNNFWYLAHFRNGDGHWLPIFDCSNLDWALNLINCFQLLWYTFIEENENKSPIYTMWKYFWPKLLVIVEKWTRKKNIEYIQWIIGNILFLLLVFSFGFSLVHMIEFFRVYSFLYHFLRTMFHNGWFYFVHWISDNNRKILAEKWAYCSHVPLFLLLNNQLQ